MPRWDHDVENRREQIINAAMRVFVRKGYTRATNRDVAQEAGITTGLIYYYFKNQEDLLKAVLEDKSAFQLLAKITPEEMEAPPEVFLPKFIGKVLDSLEEEQVVGMVKVISAEIPNNELITNLAADFARRSISALERYFGIQADKGRIRSDTDFTLVSQLIGGGLLGFILRRYLFGEESLKHYSKEDVAHSITGSILQGISLN